MRPCLPILCACAASLIAADAPKITYMKSFPRSVPAFVEIRLDKQGHAEYREATDDDNPLKIQLTEEETNSVFSLAEKLGYFSKPLESNLKVAFTGEKTFRWENGSEKREVKFNYSVEPAAQQLWDWFERITESELRYAELERAAKYDRLGVNQALLMLQATYERNRLVAASQFLPLLDRLAKGEQYLHMARERAASLADAFRNPKPVTER